MGDTRISDVRDLNPCRTGRNQCPSSADWRKMSKPSPTCTGIQHHQAGEKRVRSRYNCILIYNNNLHSITENTEFTIPHVGWPGGDRSLLRSGNSRKRRAAETRSSWTDTRDPIPKRRTSPIIRGRRPDGGEAVTDNTPCWVKSLFTVQRSARTTWCTPHAPRRASG